MLQSDSPDLMRLKIATLILKIGLLLLGLALLAAAIFAVQLGLDNDPGWGKGRLLMAVAGGLMLLADLGLQVWGAVVQSALARRLVLAWRQVGEALSQSQFVRGSRSAARALSARVSAFPPVEYLRASPGRSAFFSAGLGVLITLFFYAWYLTSGTLTVWKPYSNYFDKLASAFLAGQLSLLEKPPAELVALANPYDYHNRAGLGYLWDASLYHGQYYYYWGPVPALLELPVKALAGPGLVIDDQVILFGLCAGLVMLLAALLARLRRLFFPAAPTWTLLPLVLLGGLSIPVFWLINRPSVYETAIASGQFFLFLGLYAALRSLDRPAQSGGWLLLAGVAWGAAINSRMSLAGAVLFFVVLLAWRILRCQGHPREKLAALAWLGAPLALWAAGLGWYNAARFGSIFETGHRYQLTGMAMPSNYRDVTSLAYILPSLYGYLIRPLQFSSSFPFVLAPFIKETTWPWWIRLPEHYYYAEPLAGLLAAVPGVWLAFLPLLGVLRRGWRWLHEQPRLHEQPPVNEGPPAWLWLALVGGFACVFAPLLIFISTSMRYLADIMPLATLLAACGLWYGLRFWHSRPGLQRLLALVAVLLISASIIMSLLVNFTNGDKRFEANNPALYYAIARLFK